MSREKVTPDISLHSHHIYYAMIRFSDIASAVKKYNPKADFDIILLDFDDKLGRSFHALEIERFGPEKIIGISSVPKWNEEARKRGVKRIILKDYAKMDEFADQVVKEIADMIRELTD